MSNYSNCSLTCIGMNLGKLSLDYFDTRENTMILGFLDPMSLFSTIYKLIYGLWFMVYGLLKSESESMHVLCLGYCRENVPFLQLMSKQPCSV